MWARVFMTDLSLSDGLSGEIALYDIDIIAANRNKAIGDIINQNPKTISKFNYKVYDNVDEALKDATFVVMSILPGTFEEMACDVHIPNKWGIYQSVGDTVGPGGVLRAMRTVPIYEEYTEKIKRICPKAWVINFTNPMTILTKTLYDCFPEIKAFGCCHEVFNAQDFLRCVLKEEANIDCDRHEIYTDASGINHFTWIREAKYHDVDILKLIPSFKEKFFEEGYCEHNGRFSFKTDPFMYANKVKMDLFEKYNVLAAAGDRHLVEFVDNKWYLENEEKIKDWGFNITPVDYRVTLQNERIQETLDYISLKKEFPLEKSNEEAVEIIKALLGFKTLVTNVNTINYGQVNYLDKGVIVESNCVFSNDQLYPVISKDLPNEVVEMIKLNSDNIELLYVGIKKRDLNIIFNSFRNQPLLKNLSDDECFKMFELMCYSTRKYLDKYYDLDSFFRK